jgi:hypothetical protein
MKINRNENERENISERKIINENNQWRNNGEEINESRRNMKENRRKLSGVM